MKKFIPLDNKNILRLSHISFSKNEIISALKKLGAFDDEIYIEYSDSDYFNVGVTTIDKNGVSFTFEGSLSEKLDEIMVTEKDSRITVIYSFLVGGNKRDITIIAKKLIERLNNDYFYETTFSSSNGHPIRRSIKKENLTYSFATSSLYKFKEDLFKAQVGDSESLTFMEFVELVKNNLYDIETDIAFLTFTADKHDKEIGRIIVEKGTVTRFSLVEEQDKQVLTINLENGALIEKSTITLGTALSSLPQPLISTIEKARRLVKGQN